MTPFGYARVEAARGPGRQQNSIVAYAAGTVCVDVSHIGISDGYVCFCLFCTFAR